MATFINGVKVVTKRTTKTITKASIKKPVIDRSYSATQWAANKSEDELLSDVLVTGYLTAADVLQLVNRRLLAGQPADKAENLSYWDTMFHCLLTGMPQLCAESYAQMESAEYIRLDYKPKRNGGYTRS